MEKDLLRKFLEKYPLSSADEARELQALKASYPYSQLLHVLAARASKDHDLEAQKIDLQLAAIYSADRAILKHMMSADTLAILAGQANGGADAPAKITRSITKEPPVNQDDTADLADRVIKDVKELYETRHNFEMMFVDNPGADLHASPDHPDGHLKSKRERIIELSKALNAQQMTEEDEMKVPKKKRELRKDIIDEIVHTKEKIEPANDKQKEQLEIIEHFIKAQPSISNAKEKPAQIQEGDLSTIRAGEFGDNIVSETLVELLLKQGKKEKAVEVLKKLIWKFPQKKAYFAAQIEELKK